MRIETYLNTTREEVAARWHNVWIGISLGNRYFSKQNIAAYIRWALQHTREGVLVVVADAIHAINLEVFDGMAPEAALKKALRLGDAKFAEVQEVVRDLPEREQVAVVRWKDVLGSLVYRKNLDLVCREFKENPAFHDRIIGIVKRGRQDRAASLAKLSSAQMDRLAEYVLNELPHFVDGVQGYGTGLVYTCIPYPGLSDLDRLVVGLNRGTEFPALAQKLAVKNRVAILEAYVR